MTLTDSKCLWISEVTRLFLWTDYLEKPLLFSPRVPASREYKMVQAIQDFCHPLNPGLPVPTVFRSWGEAPLSRPLCIVVWAPWGHSTAYPQRHGGPALETQGFSLHRCFPSDNIFHQIQNLFGLFLKRRRWILIWDTIFVAPTAEEMGKEFFSHSASERKEAVNKPFLKFISNSSKTLLFKLFKFKYVFKRKNDL